MKKSLIACVAAAMLTGIAGCSDKNAATGSADNAAFLDSLATINGEAIGANFASFLNNPNAPRKFDKAEVLRGIREVMKCDTANLSYFIGLQMGMEAFQNYMNMATAVDGVSRQKLMTAIQKTVMADSVTADMMQLRQEAGLLNQKLQELRTKKAEEAKINSPEAAQNRKDAEEFFNALSDVKRTDNGIAYKTITPGKDKAVESNSRVLAKYTITKLNGDTINTTGAEPRNMYVQGAPLKGITEALQLMHEGETATFYLPWELAYGANGLPTRNVGPCEAMAVTITVTEIPAD